MRKILISAVAGAALAVVPAMAAKPTTPPTHPTPQHEGKAKGRCKTHNVGFNAKGTLAAVPTLQQVAGGTTPDTSDDRYSGDISVNVTKANHGWPTTGNPQTFTLDNAKVSFYNDTKTLAVGDFVSIHGKITKQVKKCKNFTPEIKSIRSVSFTPATPPAAPDNAAPTS